MSEPKTYTYEEVFSASETYFNGNELAARVFTDKYALKNRKDQYLELTPDDMHIRLAKEFARIDSEKYGLDFESRFNVYLQALSGFSTIVPQGSVMSAVGNTEQIMSASNCVVIDSPKDSIDGIFQSGKEMAQLYKRRCGVGIEYLHIATRRVSCIKRCKDYKWSLVIRRLL